MAALRPAEMGEQDDLGALVGKFGMVGATRSMRVASVTLPSATGTLRSTRTSTRLPLTSPIVSSVLNAAIGDLLLSSEKPPDLIAQAPMMQGAKSSQQVVAGES